MRNRLIVVKRLVKEILIEDARARNCDSYLYLKVLNVLSATNRININHVLVKDFLINMSAWGFPPFESVRRARQKIQREFPELSGNEKTQSYRNGNEIVYRDFARSRENGRS